MLLVRNTFKAYLMLAVLAVFAVLVNYLPAPVALHQNSKAVLSGGAKILNPDWRPVPGEKLLPAADLTAKSPLDMEPDLFVLLAPADEVR
jgi:hypothetical protein